MGEPLRQLPFWPEKNAVFGHKKIGKHVLMLTFLINDLVARDKMCPPLINDYFIRYKSNRDVTRLID